MDTNSLPLTLCMDGARAEFEGRPEDAAQLYREAWEAAQDDYEACIAAHYVARFQATPQDTLHWNQVALARAEAVGDERVAAFYPSLYVNLGRSFEVLGHETEAHHYYKLAADLGLVHQADGEAPPH